MPRACVYGSHRLSRFISNSKLFVAIKMFCDQHSPLQIEYNVVLQFLFIAILVLYLIFSAVLSTYKGELEPIHTICKSICTQPTTSTLMHAVCILCTHAHFMTHPHPQSTLDFEHKLCCNNKLIRLTLPWLDWSAL